MKILCNKPLLDKFRRECRKLYPLEHMAALYGQRSDEGNLVITDIVPIATGSADAIHVHHSTISRSKRAALRREKDWLGTIHSHCSTPTDWCCIHPSPSDIKSALQWGEAICGIVRVYREGAKSEVSWFVPKPIPEVFYYRETNSK